MVHRTPIIAAAVLSVCIGSARADVDRQSIFYDARTPASVLDLTLAELQRSWNLMFLGKTGSPKPMPYSLIATGGVAVEFRYARDRIELTGWIMNTDQFLSMQLEDRKSLVRQTVEFAHLHLLPRVGLLVDKKTGRSSDSLSRRHLKVRLLLNEILVNNRGENIRTFFLPNDLGAGQAGYLDGQFIFSRDYYLNLRVVGGKAVAGDARQFVVEKEESR
jgi:hypothetical protein